MKKILFVLCIMGIIIGSAVVVYAEETVDVYVNGEKLITDQPAIIYQDRTMVPLRAICEALNCKVTWDESTQTAIIENDVRMVSVQINNYYLSKKFKNTIYDEKAVQVAIDTPPILYNGRTLVPARAVSEALNMVVNWDAIRNRVNIDTSALDKFINDIDYDGIERVEKSDGSAQVALHRGNRIVLIANYIINGEITMIDYRERKTDGTVEYFSLIPGSNPEQKGVWDCLYLSQTYKDGLLTYYDENGNITSTRHVE